MYVSACMSVWHHEPHQNFLIAARSKGDCYQTARLCANIPDEQCTYVSCDTYINCPDFQGAHHRQRIFAYQTKLGHIAAYRVLSEECNNTNQTSLHVSKGLPKHSLAWLVCQEAAEEAECSSVPHQHPQNPVEADSC